MRTARFVMIVLLIAAAAASAQDATGGQASASIDQDITLVGRDEAELGLPGPWEPAPFAFPILDLQRPATPLAPPILPPSGDWGDFAQQAGYTYVGCAGAPAGAPHPRNGDSQCST
jgi:hypothetical protein